VRHKYRTPGRFLCKRWFASSSNKINLKFSKPHISILLHEKGIWIRFGSVFFELLGHDLNPLAKLDSESQKIGEAYRTAGRFLCRRRWFASSSNPHWQMARVAPVSFTCRKNISILNHIFKIWFNTYRYFIKCDHT